MTERIDIHFHMLGKEDDFQAAQEGRALYWKPSDNQNWQTWLTNGFVELTLLVYERDLGLHGKLTTEQYFEIAYRSLAGSVELDAVVLLALDAVYTSTHTPEEIRTDLWVPNTYLAVRIEALNTRFKNESHNKRFLLGASVHPFRLDWEAKLDEALALGAVLLKLIPSVQVVDLAEVDKAFWKKLAEAKLPLLLHVGAEYAFPEGRRNPQLDHIDKVRYPLDQGVTVIAAHGASPVFPGDPDYTEPLAELMRTYNSNGAVRLWTDTSALPMATRVGAVKKILRLIPEQYMLHGSDFPVPTDPIAYNPLDFPDMNWKSFVEVLRLHNHLDQDVQIKRLIGFSETILTAAERVLRLSPPS
jgi:hypothetical protein